MTALALVAAFLNAVFGLCLGCKAFYLGMRLGLVPPAGITTGPAGIIIAWPEA